MPHRWSSKLHSREIETMSRLPANEALLQDCEASTLTTKRHSPNSGIIFTTDLHKLTVIKHVFIIQDLHEITRIYKDLHI